MRTVSLLAAFFVFAMASCSTQPPAQAPNASTEGSTLVQTGQVTAVRDVTTAGGQTSGLGPFIGGVLGGIAGSSIGGGYGRTAAAIGGGVAGGIAGHQVEAAGTTRQFVAVTVRLENGEERTYNIDTAETFQPGDTVKVITSGGSTRITH
ncbi:glycine zipper 2TM domain-containing protein [Noviherbaspirillum cavernae]|uniref:Glycine zipper 2TM domain-containing protein n=1 Tax=Noviherbaspirillum cavernae TaxID=2320862 RepID=A0A418WYC2_9BURK|nr:glycine zipper 2TM domain-containing protein [Noviherbaspirillum cavernae]RJG05095.1 glycine zipper 2TM domain-containing protein [Noviherbaspirillum cavernae]